MRKIVGIGETVLDVIFRNDTPTAAVPGGSTFNAMISLGRTVPRVAPGTPIEMVTEVGDDHIGDIVVSFMERNGVGTGAVTRNRGTQTHVSMAFLDDNNDARYEFYKDHAHASLSADKVDNVAFSKDDIVLFGSFFAINPVIRGFTRALLANARATGAIIYYDINFRENHIDSLAETLPNIEENCRLADFVRGSAEDFQYLFGTSDGRELYKRYIGPLCPGFILTKGAGPIEVYTDRWELTFPVRQIETVSTIGAGDNFNAGFLYSLAASGVCREDIPSLGPADWNRSLEIASRFSAAVCRSVWNYVEEGFDPNGR